MFVIFFSLSLCLFTALPFIRAAQVGREVLDMAARLVRPGITTEEIDAAVHELTLELGAYPSPLNYNHFPKSCCT